MGYRLEIQENALLIQGLYGKYEAKDVGEGRFLVKVDQEAYVNEIDDAGEEYLVDMGQAWEIPTNGLSELNEFVGQCESERLWNFKSGPVFRMKPDVENGVLYIRGYNKNFIVGQLPSKKMYVDETQNVKTHNEAGMLRDVVEKMVKEDKWWKRPAEETLDMLLNTKCTVRVTSGGSLQAEYKNKVLFIGQKDDETFWISVQNGNDKHLFYRDSWKEVMALFAG